MGMVKRDDLLKCLAYVEPGLSSKDVIEQSSSYVLRRGRLHTFNDNVSCSVKLPDGMRTLECAIPSAEFRNLLSKLTDDELDVSMGGKDGAEDQLLLRMKQTRRAGIRVQLSITSPVDEIEMPKNWVSVPNGFAEAVETVGQVAGTGESLFTLCCIHITPKGIEACDNFQAIRYRLPTGLSGSVLVRKDDLTKIAKLDLEEWSLSDSWLHVRNSSGLQASCRRWDQDYMKLGPLLNVDGQEGVLPKGLEDAIQKAEVFASSKDNLTGLTINLNSSRLLLRAEGSVGWYEERQRVEYHGEPVSFRTAPRLLKEVCRRASRCVIGETKLKVFGENYVYISCLFTSDSEVDS